MSTGAQAAALVAAARFPPQGVRGFGNPFTQLAWGPGVSAFDYLARANDNVLVLLQIETREGVQNVDEIVAVDGVGAVNKMNLEKYDLVLMVRPPQPRWGLGAQRC